LKISVHNRQRAWPVRLVWLRRLAAVALNDCAPYSADGRFALRALEEVEVSIVSDRVIAVVHQRFMNIPGPTDVITFEHGEIVMSAQTAHRYAMRYGHPLDHELALYIIHGLLHLNGYEDALARDAARMRDLQQRLLRACLAQVPPL
jgi:probable rRNA maturation factor